MGELAALQERILQTWVDDTTIRFWVDHGKWTVEVLDDAGEPFAEGYGDSLADAFEAAFADEERRVRLAARRACR